MVPVRFLTITVSRSPSALTLKTTARGEINNNSSDLAPAALDDFSFAEQMLMRSSDLAALMA